MKNSLKCLLCNSKTMLFHKEKNKKYYKCEKCYSIMLDPENYVSYEEEKERYKTHNNDVYDIRYQTFVSPIVQGVKDNYNSNHIGLDYGAGTGPVIAYLLEKEDYQVKLYDPYFHDYPKNLCQKYDYIICSEMIEHFHKPYAEFKTLRAMLKAKGSIVCMTSLYDETINFETWHYKDDETHVFFYHRKALEWIKNEFAFSKLELEAKLIRLSD